MPRGDCGYMSVAISKLAHIVQAIPSDDRSGAHKLIPRQRPAITACCMPCVLRICMEQHGSESSKCNWHMKTCSSQASQAQEVGMRGQADPCWLFVQYHMQGLHAIQCTHNDKHSADKHHAYHGNADHDNTHSHGTTGTEHAHHP